MSMHEWRHLLSALHMYRINAGYRPDTQRILCRMCHIDVDPNR